MKWLKRMFSRKEKENVPEIEEEVREHKHECSACNKPIYIGEKWSKQGGLYFHRKCYKSMLQQY